MTIKILPGSQPDLVTVMAKVREDRPTAVHGIIIVFNEDGTMSIYHSCGESQMAWASVRLAWLANISTDGEYVY